MARVVAILLFLLCSANVIAEITGVGETESALRIKLLSKQLQDLSEKLSEQGAKIVEQAQTIADQNVKLAELLINIAQQNTNIANLDIKIVNQDLKIANQETAISNQDSVIANQDSKIAIQDTKIANQENDIARQDAKIRDQEMIVANQNAKIVNQETVIDNLDTRLSNQEITIANQNVKIANQKTSIANQDANIAKQDVAIANLRADTASQIARLENNNYANVSYHDFYAQMKAIVMALTGSHKTVGDADQCPVYQEKLDEMRNTLDTLTDKIDELKITENWKNWTRDVVQNESGKDFIGFDAVLQENIVKASAGRRIVFNNVLQNAGNAFKEGVFTCPIPGMYYFSWTTLANPGISSDTLLMLNGVAKRINYARDHTTKQYYSGTAAILLHLNRGDQVWIQMRYSGSNAHNGHSFFTGMLLKGD